MLGKNTLLVPTEDRFFESASGKYRLRVDPAVDLALVEHFDRAARIAGTELGLAEKIAHVVDWVYRTYAYNKENRNSALGNFVSEIDSGEVVAIRSLGSLLDVRESAVTCWEKAAFCHLLLAEIGVPSTLVGGNTAEGSGHAWLELDLGALIVDPTWRRIEHKSFHSDYVPARRKKIAFPLRSVEESTLRTALIEARTYLDQNRLLFENGHEQLLLEQAILKAQRREEELVWESRMRRLRATPVTPLAAANDPRNVPALYAPGGLLEL